jgi:hypothetical protein
VVKHDVYPPARERIAQLIESARAAIVQIQPHQLDTDSTALFRATWTASQAAGFLEAFALIDPALAGEMLADFESVAGFFDRLRATGRVGNQETPDVRGASDARGQELPMSELDRVIDRRLESGPAGNIRRVAVRRAMLARRTRERRQLRDRRGW